MKKTAWLFYTDEDLMQEFCKGKNEAFDEIYKRFYKKLIYFILQSTSFSMAESKDLLQDVFLKVIENKHLFKPSKKLSVWIYRIATNQCNNAYKHLNVRDKFEDELKHNSINQPARIHDIERVRNIRIIIKELKPIYKQVFLLRFNFGFSIKETAEILDLAEGTVKSRLFNCIQQLSKNKKLKKSIN